MKQFINNLRLAVKINVTTFIAVLTIIILAFVVYFANTKASATMAENTSSISTMNHLTYKIQTLLDEIEHTTLQNAIEKQNDYKKRIDTLYKQLMNDLQTLKQNPYLAQDKQAQKIIFNITQRIAGYRLIAKNFREDEDSEDAFYSILALSSANKKIADELSQLSKKILEISQTKIKKLNNLMFRIKITIVIFLLCISALLIYINRSIVNSILQRIELLKEEILSFFDLLSHKRDTVCHIEIEGKDEIAEIMKIIDKSAYIAEKIVEDERNQSKLIKQKVEEGVKEIKALNEEIEATQREVVFTMGAIAEQRSKETGQHVQRVAEYSLILARLHGLSLEDSMLLKNASPMHDIGKVGIPDAILHKPGRLTQEEFEVMKTHTEIGYQMLKHSKRSILKAAAIVAHQHHERWDGKGYPQGLKGEEIHIFGRITAIADVFDALGSDRVYKKAWPLQKILQLFEEERGKQFDPHLVDLFLDNLEYFLAAKENIEKDEREPSLSEFIENFEKVPEYLF